MTTEFEEPEMRLGIEGMKADQVLQIVFLFLRSKKDVHWNMTFYDSKHSDL